MRRANAPILAAEEPSVRGQSHDPSVITTHGRLSRKTSRRASLVKGKAIGSQPGSTRSTVTPPMVTGLTGNEEIPLLIVGLLELQFVCLEEERQMTVTE